MIIGKKIEKFQRIKLKFWKLKILFTKIAYAACIKTGITLKVFITFTFYTSSAICNTVFTRGRANFT